MSNLREAAILVVVGMGFPLSQVVIRTFGRAGAGLVEGIAAAVLARDAALLAGGAAKRMERAPLGLLVTETAAAGVAVVAGLRLLQGPDPRARTVARRTTPAEAVRRAALGAMFGMESWRLRMQRHPPVATTAAAA
jgi:hypothetical protein